MTHDGLLMERNKCKGCLAESPMPIDHQSLPLGRELLPNAFEEFLTSGKFFGPIDRNARRKNLTQETNRVALTVILVSLLRWLQ
jgi:hypothetical protein